MYTNKKLILFLMAVIVISTFFSSCSPIGALLKGCDRKLNSSVLATYGNLEGVQEAVAAGANVNHVAASDHTDIGWTDHNPASLMLHCASGNIDISEYLIEHGSNPNYIGDFGISLLMDSASCNNLDFCQFLLNYGANINLTGKDAFSDYSALDFVFYNNASTDLQCYDLYKFMLNHGAKITPHTVVAAINQKRSLSGPQSSCVNQGLCRYSLVQTVLKDLISSGQKSNLNPLVEATILGDENKITSLMNLQNVSDNDKKLVMVFTAALGNVNTMKLLVEKSYNLNAIDDNGFNLMTIAASYNNVAMLQFLHSKGLDCNLAGYDDPNPLTEAIYHDKIDNAKYLISIGAKLQIGNISGNTVTDSLEYATWSGKLDAVKFTVDNGYTLTNNDNNVYNAMKYATCNKMTNILEYFFQKGESPNNPANQEDLLTAACLYPTGLDTVKFLVEHGANPNGVVTPGNPLFSACQTRSYAIVEYLISKGVNVNYDTQDNEYGTPLYGAMYSGSVDIVKLLVEHGAKVDSTMVGYAKGQPSQHIIDYLKSNSKS